MRELEPGDIVDGFQINRVMARGAMGSLFRAHHHATGRDVVLKVPHPSFECDVVFYSRFLREEQIGRRLDHPGLVRVIPVEKKSRPYIAMEYVDGRSLRETAGTRTPQPVEWVVAVGKQICAALAYMHREGVVHRDIKPENILVGTTGTVCIVDFGTAMDRSAQRLTWGSLSARLGTPAYMAPEKIRGKRGDARTDVYALGVVLYELLSGTTPYETTDPIEVLRAKRTRSPRPMASVAPHVDRSLAEVVMRALAHDPDERIASANEMLAMLENPSRVDALPRLRPAARGHALWLAMACVALLGFAWVLVRVW
jgi:serine/threonine-protein kinase